MFESTACSAARAREPAGDLPRAVLQDGRQRGAHGHRDGEDDDLPGRHALSKPTRLDLRQPEGGRLRIRHGDARQDHRPGEGAAGQHRRARGGDGQQDFANTLGHAKHACDRPVPRWRRCGRTPTSWRASSPTTSGRWRPTRRCCSSSRFRRGPATAGIGDRGLCPPPPTLCWRARALRHVRPLGFRIRVSGDSTAFRIVDRWKRPGRSRPDLLGCRTS